MTTHHDDDDAWLDALAGKKNASKNPETDLLREKLLKRNKRLMERIDMSTNEMEAIRQRLPGFDMGDWFLIGFCRFPVSIERQIRGLRDFWGQYSESSVGTIISL